MRLYAIALFLFIFNFSIAFVTTLGIFPVTYQPYITGLGITLENASSRMIPSTTGGNVFDAALGYGTFIINGFMILAELFLRSSVGLYGFMAQIGVPTTLAFFIATVINLVYIAGIISFITSRDLEG